MTRELLAEANKINHAINNLEQQIRIVEGMHHSDSAMTLGVDTIGAITIAWAVDLKTQQNGLTILWACLAGL